LKVLSLETSGRWGGFCLWDDGIVVEAIFEGREYSTLLASSLKEAVENSSWRWSGIELVVVSQGPGSFTGLRIGMSLGKGISLVQKIPLISIPTYEVIKRNFDLVEFPLLLLFPSRKGEVILFEWERDKWVKEGEIVKIEKIPQFIEKEKIIAGEGVLLYRDWIEKKLKGKVLIPPFSYHIARPSHLAVLGIERKKEAGWEKGISASPLYFREPRIGDKN